MKTPQSNSAAADAIYAIYSNSEDFQKWWDRIGGKKRGELTDKVSERMATHLRKAKEERHV